MGERIYFATSNWKDKPDKPSCLSQGEWDALHSSKFNGAPFAGSLAPDIFQKGNKHMISGYDKDDIKTFKDGLAALVHQCDNGSVIKNPHWDFPLINQPQPKEIEVPCDKIKATVWDGSTYFDFSDTVKTVTWKTCRSGYDRSAVFGLIPPTGTSGIFPKASGKYPSASSDIYIPVCGSGTHIREISRDKASEIIWRVSQLDMELPTTTLSFLDRLDSQNWCVNDCSQAPNPQYLETKADFKFTTKNLQPKASEPGKESDIVNLKWDTTSETGYTGKKKLVIVGGQDYSPSTNQTNGNFQFVHNANYSCGGINDDYYQASTECNITLKPFDKRHEAFFFIEDKVYFDITKLLNFKIVPPEAQYGGWKINDIFTDYQLDPGNINARFELKVSFLDMNFTIKVSGPKDLAQGDVGIDNSRTARCKNGPDEDDWSDLTMTAKGKVTRTFTPGEIKLKPIKYYPYANSKGEDIYNKDTGQQLKDPTS